MILLGQYDHSRFVLSLVDPPTDRLIALLDTQQTVGIHDCCVSRDGSTLAAASDTCLQLWDLKALKKKLAALGLDW